MTETLKTHKSDENTAQDFVLTAASRWLDAGETVALATVIDTWGSSAVPKGGQMVIADEERFFGSVSGGCVEGDIIAAAMDAMTTGKPQLLEFGVADETAWRAGLPCGGNITIFVQRLTDRERQFIDQLQAAQNIRRPVSYTVELTTGKLKFLEDTPDKASSTAQPSQPRLKSGRMTLEGHDVFLNILEPRPRIAIIGATAIAQHLVLMANVANYDTIVIDPRPAFANETRFPNTKILANWPADALPEMVKDSYTAIVTLAHADRIDDEALATALRAPVRYVGALGSRRTHQARVERLRNSGFNDLEIGRIKSPIGLDLGGRSPGEIAIAILAEIVLAFRKQPNAT